MDTVENLKSAWIFDKKGNVKQTKTEIDKAEAPKIYLLAK